MEIIFPNAPCSLINVEYRDLMGQEIHQIPLQKIYVNDQGRETYTKKYEKVSSLQEIKNEAKEFPGCKMKGEFDQLLKVKAEVHLNFRENMAIYQALKRDTSINVNMAYRLQSLVFGGFEKYINLFRYLEPYDDTIRSYLNPAEEHGADSKGNMLVKYNMHVFPIEFKSDFSGT